MRICDRCRGIQAGPVQANEGLRFTSTNEMFDLCRSCADKTREFITEPIKKKKTEIEAAFGLAKDIKKPTRKPKKKT